MFDRFPFSIHALVILGSITYFITAQSEPSTMDFSQAEFALNLLRKSAEVGESMIISPFSISVALAMTYAGAKSETHDQMSKVLAAGISDEEFHNNMGRLLENISKGNAGYRLNSANRVYIKKDFEVLEEYLEIIKSKYAGQLERVDFTQSAAIAKEINEWVENQTNSRITDLVNPGMFNSDSRMLLINAVYFKAEWDNQFKERNTKKQPFYEAENQQRMVDMMAIRDKFPYYENDKVQVLGLPYKTREVTMYVFLPKKKYGLAEFTDGLTGKEMLEVINNATSREVIVEFPKFKLEEKFQLVDVLKQIGIKDAFNDHADFSGITNSPVFISDVVHKAFIEVDEKGTEAAAATGIQIMLMSANISLDEPVTFIADHPFMFAIVYGNTVLFIGRVH